MALNIWKYISIMHLFHPACEMWAKVKWNTSCFDFGLKLLKDYNEFSKPMLY